MHAAALLSTRGQSDARSRAVRALARSAAAAYKAAAAAADMDDDDDGGDDADHGGDAATLADDSAWTVQAVHLVIASEGLLPAFARTRLYVAATWTLLRHGGGGGQGVAVSLATGIASLAAAGDVWEVCERWHT